MYEHDYYFSGISICISSFVVIVIICLIILSRILSLSDEREYERFDVVSIDLNNEIEGSFVVGSGSVAEETYYVFYKVLPDGGLSFMKISVERTVIYETLSEGETAYIELEKNFAGFIICAKLYVPEGVVLREYDLSLSDL